MTRNRDLDKGPESAKDSGVKIESAVGLAFDGKSTPTVSVSGKGEISKIIQDRARRYGVPVRKDPKLARKLENLEAEEEIPLDCYQEVAELLISVDND